MRFCCTIIALVALGAGSTRTEDGFTPLFNGKDLAGWSVENMGQFSARDGVIFLNKGAGWLRSQREYQDFELRLDFRFLNKEADSGIFLRASKEGKIWPAKNYQVQTMDNESIAALFATALTKGKGKRDVAAMRRARKPTGEWQAYVIIMKGDHAEIHLNGALITVADGLTVRPGFIGLQGEGGQLEFKNIRIKELKESAR